jgi:hypothetical protein
VIGLNPSYGQFQQFHPINEEEDMKIKEHRPAACRK